MPKLIKFVFLMEFIDTHTHNSDEAYAGCEDEVIRRARAAGISTLIQPDVDSRERDAMFSLCERHPGVLYPMIGLYPGSVDENWRDEVDLLSSYRSRGPVAMGEIGLDYHYGAQTKELQKEAFRAQMELAAQWDLPVNIHLREATEDFFSIMDDCAGLHLRGNLHAFSGSYETFQRLQKYGEWYVGIGGVVTFRKAGIGQDIARIPLDRIVLETDSPYLTPTPHRGERNESSYIPLIAAFIAERQGKTIEEVAERTTHNARKLFGI